MLGKTHQVGGVCAALVMSTYILKTPSNTLDFILLGSLLVSSDLGGLIPDIDLPESTIGKIFPRLSKTINTIGEKLNPNSSQKNSGHRFITHTLYLYLILIPLLLILLNTLKGQALYLFNVFIITTPIAIITYLYFSLITKITMLKIKRRPPIWIHLFLFYIGFYIILKHVTFIDMLSYITILGLAIGLISHLFLDSLTKTGIPILYPITKKKFRLLKLTTGETDNYIILILILLTILFMYFKL